VDHYNVGSPNTFGVDKLTERTNVTNGDVFKGPKRNFYSIRDQCETKNFFKRPMN
jgi:hypothetical protein